MCHVDFDDLKAGVDGQAVLATTVGVGRCIEKPRVAAVSQNKPAMSIDMWMPIGSPQPHPTLRKQTERVN
jgi:hypothetical protein